MPSASHRTSLLALCVLAITPGTPAAAAVVLTNANEFVAQTNATFIDFENDPLGPVTGQPWQPLGVTFDDMDWPDGGNMVLGDGGGYNRNLYAASGPYSDIFIAFPEPAWAAGLSIFSNDLLAIDEFVRFLDEDWQPIAQVAMPATGHVGSRFIGVTSPDRPIAYIWFSEGDEPDYAGIGDVAFAVGAVPEPCAVAAVFALAALTAGSQTGRRHARRRHRS